MRSTSLDLVKWLAMLTMVIDHLRYLWPEATAWFFVIGRFAFPLFCLGIAANVSRSRPGDLYSENNFRYLSWLLAFSFVSELPYRMLSDMSNTLNVMPTLMLGLLVAWSVHHSGRTGLILGLATLTAAGALHNQLMYGAFGVLLPATMVLAIQRPGATWLVPAVFSVLANSRYGWTGVGPFDTWWALVSTFLAPLVGLWLLKQKISRHVWPVGRWGYFFYPGHITVLVGLRAVI
ncbi:MULTISPECIES: TraX family protein [Pseudomonas]|uniref:TraX family protein n=1 Tax=Pseudomonas TaxID=286 RepID=UPI0003758C57|nr:MULTISPECIES: TraX family protein [Pseudomonas]MDG9927753.1 conjugal transfer protein TraX [Pseudomonas sp. GD04042]MDH0483148.1 conjugal transfer protein TraX [Pseudomonas sp. GD04015]MDH0605341.1 conjugal transfer protein TraX [Pseudomonas sp. GD03869]